MSGDTPAREPDAARDCIEAVRAAEAAARTSYGKLIAFLSARTRDVAGAEDALSESFAAALAEWPVHGVPQTPEAWLLTVARRRLVERLVAQAGDPEVVQDSALYFVVLRETRRLAAWAGQINPALAAIRSAEVRFGV